ncbi:MAG: flagellar protein FliT [Azoarcus sp.]|jgi:flagellar protein FliT|nr:flagellar protein FliT [Azoarcus sp.]
MNTSGHRPDTHILSLKEGEALLALYEAMAEAARARDWDRLIETEQRAAAIRDAAIARPPAPMTEDAARLSALITRIQSLDREIRGHLEPAREEMRRQLAIEVKGRSMRSAYGDIGDTGGAPTDIA